MAYQRPSKTEYYLNHAKIASQMSTCLRRRFGAAIVQGDVVVSSGYNGSARGVRNCIDIGECIRQKLNIPSGERYELCRSVHAEQNAIINAARHGTKVLGGILYLYGENVSDGSIVEGKPCKLCKREIINAGIEKVVIARKDNTTVEITLEQMIAEENEDYNEQNIKGY